MLKPISNTISSSSWWWMQSVMLPRPGFSGVAMSFRLAFTFFCKYAIITLKTLNRFSISWMYSPLTLRLRTLLTPVIVLISRFTSCLPLLPLEQGMCINIIHRLIVQCCTGRHLCWGIVLVENVKKDYSCGVACRQSSCTTLRTDSFSMAVFFIVLGRIMLYTVHIMTCQNLPLEKC